MSTLQSVSGTSNAQKVPSERSDDDTSSKRHLDNDAVNKSVTQFTGGLLRSSDGSSQQAPLNGSETTTTTTTTTTSTTTSVTENAAGSEAGSDAADASSSRHHHHHDEDRADTSNASKTSGKSPATGETESTTTTTTTTTSTTTTVTGPASTTPGTTTTAAAPSPASDAASSGGQPAVEGSSSGGTASPSAAPAPSASTSSGTTSSGTTSSDPAISRSSSSLARSANKEDQVISHDDAPVGDGSGLQKAADNMDQILASDDYPVGDFSSFLGSANSFDNIIGSTGDTGTQGAGASKQPSLATQTKQASGTLASYMDQNGIQSVDPNKLYSLANNQGGNVPTDVQNAAKFMLAHPDVYKAIETNDAPGADGISGKGNFEKANLGQVNVPDSSQDAQADGLSAKGAAGTLASYMDQNGIQSVDANKLYSLAINQGGNVPTDVQNAAKFMLSHTDVYKAIETNDVAGADGISGKGNFEKANLGQISLPPAQGSTPSQSTDDALLQLLMKLRSGGLGGPFGSGGQLPPGAETFAGFAGNGAPTGRTSPDGMVSFN